MISYSGSPVKVAFTSGSFGSFTEAPWFYKRNSTYYMAYAANGIPEDIRYSTAPSATGPWTYRGIIMAKAGGSFTNHEGLIDYKGNSYFFYHNGALPGGNGYQRSACVERFVYNSDGSIPTIGMTTTGVPQIGTLNPYVQQEAETGAWFSAVETEVCSEGGMNVGSIKTGAYIKVKGVAFGAGAKTFTARVSSATSGGTIQLRLGSATGTLVGTCTVAGTGDWQKWTSVTCPISGATGTQDLYFVFGGSGTGFLLNFNWWIFDGATGAPTTSISGQSTTLTTLPVTTSTSLTTSTTVAAPTTTSSSPSGACAGLYAQCGGTGWGGASCCSQGSCKYSNPYYSQCLT